MADITKKAMLANLRISQWTCQSADKDAILDFLADKNATSKAGKFQKNLINPEATQPIRDVVNKARKMHYHMTLPWTDNGSRLLPAELFHEYIENLREMRDEFTDAVEQFCKDYPQHVAEAKKTLGDLFDPADYPSSIQDKFAFDFVAVPIPTADDFRITLSKEHLEDIKSGIEKEISAGVKEANQAIWRRVFELVNHIANKLAEPKAVFRDSTIVNLRELAAMLPALNVMGDKKLTEMGRELERTLAGLDPDTLRKDKTERAAAATVARTAADDILKRMGGEDDVA